MNIFMIILVKVAGFHCDCDYYINTGAGAEAGCVGSDDGRRADGNFAGCSVGGLGEYFYDVDCGCDSGDVGGVDGDGVDDDVVFV